MLTREQSPMPRRSFLAGIAAAPAALAVATAPLPALAVETQPATTVDAAVIRLSNRVTRLAAIEHRLHRRSVAIEEGIVEPPAPEKPAKQPINTTFCGWSSDGLEFRALYDRPWNEGSEQQAAFEASMAVWKAECADLRESARLPAVERLREAMLDRLAGATDALAGMRSRTVSGLVAKSRAWLAIEAASSADTWTAALVQSLARDAVAIGGEA